MAPVFAWGRFIALCVGDAAKSRGGVVTTIFPQQTAPRGGQEGMGAMMSKGGKATLGRAAAMALFVLAGAANSEAQSPSTAQADLLIKNGHVVDGTRGAPCSGAGSTYGA